MSTRQLALGLLLAVFCFESCTAKKPAATAAAPPHSAADDSGRFLAGLPGPANGPYHALEQTEAWKKYSQDLSAQWAQSEKEQFAAVSQFQKRELGPLHTTSSYVFYPFSGPDVLYMHGFFPDGKVFVMAGLERVGELPAAAALEKGGLGKELTGWTQALDSIFNRSFFVTREMDSQFHGRVANGLLPMICLLLARSGYAITHVQYGHLDDAGKFVAEEATPGARYMGVEVKYQKAGASKTLYYFSTNLAEQFATNPAFANFLKAMGPADTLVKSASFLLHWQMCAAIRAYILDNSNLIFQDDTGIPYHYFQTPNWQVELFGEYSRPDRPFHREYQKDLAAAFDEKDKVKPLGFSLGYGYGRRPSSMLLAKRVNLLAAK